jgi:iron complex outermembrane receptor protein
LAPLFVGVSASSYAEEAASDTPVGLEEVVVTARKREERLREVPVAVTAIQSSELERRNLSSGEDILGKIPNLYVTGASAFSTRRDFTMRGVGVATPLEPAVAVFIDGAYVPSVGWDMDFMEIERLEVLRGPQGTLFGRNTQAGAINIVTRRPSKTFTGKVRLEADEFDTMKGDLYLSGPITDTVSVAVSGLGETTDGYVRNVTLGNDLLARDKYGGRAQLLIEPTDRLTVMLSADGISEEGGFWSGGEPIDGSAKDLPDWQVRYDVEPHEQLENIGSALNVDYEFDNFNLTGITSYRAGTSYALSDIDGTDTPDRDGTVTPIVPRLAARSGFPTPDRNYMFLVREQSILSQEVRLTSSTQGPLQWLVGVYGFVDHNDSSRNFKVPDSPQFTHPSNSVIDLVEQERTGYSVFGQANYQLTEKMKLTAGLRYAWEKVEQDLYDTFSIGGGALGATFSSHPSASFSDVSPSTSLAYNWSADLMTYVTVSKGYKGGGFNPSAPSDVRANVPFKEETSLLYETGWKLALFDRRMTFDGALFWTELENMQVTSTILLAGVIPTSAVTNAGKARSRGIELELAARPTENLRLGTAFSYTDAEYLDYVNAGGIDLKGGRIEETPDITAGVNADYKIPLSNSLDLTLGVEYLYVGDALFGRGLPTRPYVDVDPYDQLDLQATLGSGRWKLAVFVDNVLDKHNVLDVNGFVTFYRAAPEAFNQTVAPPRRVGIKYTVEF